MAQDGAQGQSQGGSSGGTVWAVAGGILAVGLLAFIFQNRETITFNWLIWHHSAPLWLALLITAIVAFIIGQFALMWRRHRRRVARREGRR